MVLVARRNVSTALVAFLCAGGTAQLAWGQTVTTTDDVIPSPATSPEWNTGAPLIVGYSGTGTLTLGDGGTVSSAEGYIGMVAGALGTVRVSGTDANGSASTWTNTLLFVGDSGVGTLAVEGGGTVFSVYGSIGEGTSGTGVVTVSGTDANGSASTWRSSGELNVGFNGTGTLNIADGGTVSNVSGTVGYGQNATGTVTVSGPASAWTNTSNLTVADAGNGTLIVEGGGTVSNTNSVIGWGLNGRGLVTVTGTDAIGGASTWTNAGTLTVGKSGTGTASIEGGGSVLNTSGSIGSDATGRGLVTVSGTDGNGSASTWTNSGTLTVGNSGIGTLTVADGGTVSVGNGAGGPGTLYLGSNWSASGTLNIGAAAGSPADAAGTVEAAEIRFAAGKGTLNFNHSGETVFSSALVSGGSGAHALNHQDGTTTLTGDSSRFTGSTTVSGGSLLVGDAAGTGKLGGAVAVAAGGTLGGSGTLTGAVVVDGTLSAGNSAGMLTFGNNLTLNAGSTSVFGLNTPGVVGGTGAGGNDLVRVEGTLTLGGTLDARVAAAGYYRLFDYDALATGGSFATETVTSIDSGFTVANSSVQYGIPGQINLLVLGAGQTMQLWDGGDPTGNSQVDGGDGVWQSFATNWTNSTGSANSGWGGSVGVFAGTAGTVTVQGVQAFDTLQFSTDGYRLESGALEIAVSGGGTFNVDTGVSATIASNVADGLGSLLRKVGGGTLILTGSNTYGDTLVQAGTLAGNAGSISGNIGNGAVVVFDQGGDASFAGSIGGLGGTDGAMVKRGAGMLTLAGASGLDWAIEAGGVTSATDRFGGDLDIASGASFVFDQGYAGIYAGSLSGQGSVGFTGGGAVQFTGDSSAFTGLSEVLGMTLIVNDHLGGSALIGRDARLAGGGAIGSGIGSTVTIADGGVLTPGNSIGTLTVDGNLVIGSGSRYEVEVAPGGTTSDLLAVTGTAAINGGTVAHIGMTGTYDPTSTYTILTADAGLTPGSAFGTVTSDFVFLDPTLAYSANAVTLTLTRNDIGFADMGETRNQIATANALDSLGFGNTLYNQIVQLDAGTARSAFEQLSGEIHASARTALIEDASNIRISANNRIRAAFEGVGASVAPVLTYGPDGPTLAPASHDYGMAAWGTAFGSWGRTEGDGNAAHFARSTGGVIVGADGLIMDTWRFGLLAGYSRSSFEVDDRASSGLSDTYHLGLYGGTAWGDLALRTGLAYSWHDIETSRSVAFTGFSEHLSGDYSAGVFQAFGELGYTIETEIASFEPFASLAHVSQRTGGFTETGGDAALTVKGQTTDTTFTTLGIRAETGFAIGGIEATARGMVGWRHAFGDVTPLASHAFAGSDAFTIAGTPIAGDTAIIEAGLDLNLTPDATLGLSYTGQFGSGAQDHGLTARLGVQF